MKNIAIGILGTTLDKRGKGNRRWEKWRPTLSMCQHEDLLIDRYELLLDNHSTGLAEQVKDDIALVSPETEVVFHYVNFKNPWDFESVYSTLLDFSLEYNFQADKENYLIHITTGTHVAQICLYLLTETAYLPGKLIQTSPAKKGDKQLGEYQVIDLDLSKYDQIASRFQKEHTEGTTYLKSGIETKNKQFNRMIEQLEQVSVKSNKPILLTGPTGAGKSQLARRIFDLRKQRNLIDGKFVAINCATLRGDNAMSTLFGHKKGAFTGAITDRSGLLSEAHQGILFLDEIGELGLDEQAMLLSAIEQKRFMPFGSNEEVSSDFQLIAGTNRDLQKEASNGKFREDLLARIDLWTYELPSLSQRLEDFEPNLEYELEQFSNKENSPISFNKPAKQLYLNFSKSAEATWSGNFRDLNASVTRMATLASGGRINLEIVEEEIQRLKNKWQANNKQNTNLDILNKYLSTEDLNNIDNYEKVSLVHLIKTCLTSKSMAEAGRKLFNVSRTQKSSSNDSHRVKQLLAKYNLEFNSL